MKVRIDKVLLNPRFTTLITTIKLSFTLLKISDLRITTDGSTYKRAGFLSKNSGFEGIRKHTPSRTMCSAFARIK